MSAGQAASTAFNKIVRDKIPDIIASQGRAVEARPLSDEEALEYLKKKLTEEVNEFLSSSSLEELADVAEVLRALASALGSSVSEIEKIRKKKRQTNGGFSKKILLLSAGTRANEL